MIKIPVLSAEKVSSTTQRSKPPMYEILSTILPDLSTDRSSSSAAPTTVTAKTTLPLDINDQNELEEKIKNDFFQRIENLSRTTEDTLSMDSIKKITSQLTPSTESAEITTIYKDGPKLPIISMGITSPQEFETIYPTQVPQIFAEEATTNSVETTLPNDEQERVTDPVTTTAAVSSTAKTTSTSTSTKQPAYQSFAVPEDDEASTVKVIILFRQFWNSKKTIADGKPARSVGLLVPYTEANSFLKEILQINLNYPNEK